MAKRSSYTWKNNMFISIILVLYIRYICFVGDSSLEGLITQPKWRRQDTVVGEKSLFCRDAAISLKANLKLPNQFQGL